MSKYEAPLRDMRFVLFDVLKADQALAEMPAFAGFSREDYDAVLDEAAKFNNQVLAPLNPIGDREGCRFDDGAVSTPTGFKEAYQQFVDGGWNGLVADPEHGGQGMPQTVGAAIKEMIDSANLSWGNYPLLSHGATEALVHVAEDWQREAFLKPIVAGRWTGTMCLTEPHCGTDLGLLKTRAEPGPDDTWKLYGTKIFITGGEHDMAENIVHLVLARLPDAPAGTKGISLFVVPKFKVDRSGKMGERNALSCGSIEHKMGIKASATCVMNFDGAEAYLLGAPHKGLNTMFIMMNTARLAVGLQGLGLIERAYQNALAYARDRLQMRALGGAKFPDKPADPIIVHPDVRRMLLTQKAIAEAGRALAYYAYLQEDLKERAPTPQARQKADELVSFLTPIVKGVLTELACECTYHAVQILGGHGYIAEWGQEQMARDARITTIYEGTTQIQALDLLGRKIIQLQGGGLKHFLAEIGAFVAVEGSREELQAFAQPLAALVKQWDELTLDIGRRAATNPDEMGAAAVDYLFYAGYLAMAYFWAREVAALNPQHNAEFAQAKRATARFYFARILPRADMHRAAILAGAPSLMDLPEAAFG